MKTDNCITTTEQSAQSGNNFPELPTGQLRHKATTEKSVISYKEALLWYVFSDPINRYYRFSIAPYNQGHQKNRPLSVNLIYLIW